MFGALIPALGGIAKTALPLMAQYLPAIAKYAPLAGNLFQGISSLFGRSKAPQAGPGGNIAEIGQGAQSMFGAAKSHVGNVMGNLQSGNYAGALSGAISGGMDIYNRGQDLYQHASSLGGSLGQIGRQAATDLRGDVSNVYNQAQNFGQGISNAYQQGGLGGALGYGINSAMGSGMNYQDQQRQPRQRQSARRNNGFY